MSLIDGDRLRRFLTEKKDSLDAARHRASVEDNASLGFKLAGAIQVIDMVLTDLPSYAVNLGAPLAPSARNTDPVEAHEAASANTFGRSKSRYRVYLAMQELGEGTPEEIAAKTIEMFPGQYPPNSLQRRVTELAQHKYIEKTGERRRTAAGGVAEVWRLMERTA